MAGFPSRISRSSFGPTLEDQWPIVNPKHDVGEAALNLAFWQTAGMNLTAFRGLIYVVVDEDAETATTSYQGFAWDPNKTMANLVWTRSAAGVYTFNLPESQYEDERGNLITVTLVGGAVFPQALYSGNMVLGQMEKTGARAGTVHLYVPQLNSKRDVNFVVGLI